MKRNKITLPTKTPLKSILTIDVGGIGGWCYRDDYEVITGTIKLPKKHPYSTYKKAIKDIISLYKPQMIAVLKPYGRMVGMKQSEIIGVLRLISEEVDIPFYNNLMDSQCRTILFGRCLRGSEPVIRWAENTLWKHNNPDNIHPSGVEYATRTILTEHESDAFMLAYILTKASYE